MGKARLSVQVDTVRPLPLLPFRLPVHQFLPPPARLLHLRLDPRVLDPQVDEAQDRRLFPS